MTYSIVARDPDTGDLGIAVQSHYFSVGSVVPWLEPGVGAIATQAMAEISYGPLGLDLLRGGLSPAAALSALMAADEAAPTRQVGIVGLGGDVAAHTGDRCIAEAGHVIGDGFVAMANMMNRDTVWHAMAATFGAATGDLASRLLAALDTAEDEGGDIRGRQSAALVIAPAEGPPWVRLVDVRVEDHPDPLAELRRLVEVKRAYLSGRPSTALGDNPELAFWAGVQLAAAGDIDQAKPLLAEAFTDGDHWRELLRRLPASGLFPDEPELFDALFEGT